MPHYVTVLAMSGLLSLGLGLGLGWSGSVVLVQIAQADPGLGPRTAQPVALPNWQMPDAAGDKTGIGFAGPRL